MNCDFIKEISSFFDKRFESFNNFNNLNSNETSFLKTLFQHLLSLEESNVEDGSIEIDKLEDKNFEREVIFVFGLCSMHF